jgi:hypothetical protein
MGRGHSKFQGREKRGLEGHLEKKSCGVVESQGKGHSWGHWRPLQRVFKCCPWVGRLRSLTSVELWKW